MSVHIIYEMPDGSGVVTTNVGHELGGITAFQDHDEAVAAVFDTFLGEPNFDLGMAVWQGKLAIEANNPYKEYEDMSTLKLLFHAITSLRFGKSSKRR